MTGLERFREGQWLTSKFLADLPWEEARRLLQARGVLPQSETGQAVFRRMAAEVQTFAERIRPYTTEPALPPRRYRLTLDGFRIDGRFTNLYPQGPVIFRYSRANGRALMAAWIEHLVFCQTAASGQPSAATVLICRDEVRRFEYTRDSAAILERLLDLYFQAGHRPLPVFPRATPVFARRFFDMGKSADQAQRMARRAWEGNDMSPGDKDDPYVALGFRGYDPWGREFETLAGELFAPLFAHSEAIA